MMLIGAHSYLHVRTAAMARRLMSPERLAALARGGTDEIDAALEVAGIEPRGGVRDISVDELERLIVRRVADETIRLVWGATAAGGGLLRHWARRYALINIKIVIRGKAAGWPPEQIQPQLFDLGRLEAIPMEGLLHSEDVEGILRQLEVGPYANMGRQARAAYEQGRNLFDTEAVFDRAYLDVLTDEVDRQPRAERAALRQFLDPMFDAVNLVWLLRYRFAYQLDPAHAYYLLGPPGAHLKVPTLMEMVRLERFDEVVDYLPPGMKKLVGRVRDVNAIAERLDRFNQDTARHVLRFASFRLGRALAYLWLRERQLMQLQGIVKGNRLELAPEMILRATGSPGGGAEGG